MLPDHVQAALDAKLFGISRKELAARAQRISGLYRDGTGTDRAIRDQLDALAYAVARMPATYAACQAALNWTAPHVPTFAPTSVLDLGSGPGAATFAALELWPGIDASTQVESSAVFRTFASDLQTYSSRQRSDICAGDLTGSAFIAPSADLVLIGYVLVELREAAVATLVKRALELTRGLLLLVEPGTPAGFERIRLARTALIAAGAKIAAPCAGDMACPMAGQDWCHFSVRLARSRDHKFLKDADVPFEDERFCYLAVTNAMSPVPASARILADPDHLRSGIDLKLCTAGGLSRRSVSRSDKANYKTARRLSWGDVASE